VTWASAPLEYARCEPPDTAARRYEEGAWLLGVRFFASGSPHTNRPRPRRHPDPGAGPRRATLHLRPVMQLALEAPAACYIEQNRQLGFAREGAGKLPAGSKGEQPALRRPPPPPSRTSSLFTMAPPVSSVFPFFPSLSARRSLKTGLRCLQCIALLMLRIMLSAPTC
jgi:hypothetical protein